MLNFFLFRVVTGSFDKSVRIWSIDGKPIHRMNNFLAPVSSLCYCPRDKTIWVTAGLSSASLFEPKSGDNVSLKRLSTLNYIFSCYLNPEKNDMKLR